MPPVAVTRNDDQAVITIMYNGKPTLTPIILGQTFPSGIEVAAGINAGDVIALPDDNKSDREESVPTRTGPRISSASSVEY